MAREDPAGSVSKGMILNVDFAPTLLDAAGRQRLRICRGSASYPCSKAGRHALARRCITATITRAITTSRPITAFAPQYKLIYFNKLDQWELYDLRKDPRETRNVYGDPAYAKMVEELKKELTG